MRANIGYVPNCKWIRRSIEAMERGVLLEREIGRDCNSQRRPEDLAKMRLAPNHDVTPIGYRYVGARPFIAARAIRIRER
jgi:hypothetical protein